MRSYRLVAFLGMLFAGSFVLTGFPALAVTPSFTITATSATLSSSTSSGAGTSSFTLTSVNGYTGQVFVGCQPPPTLPAGVKVPYCGAGSVSGGNAAVPAIPPITLTANEVATGIIPFFNFPVPSCGSGACPVSLPRRGGHNLARGLALAAALLFGFGFRRRAARWLTLIALAVGTLAGLAGISACGGNKSVVTPGTYAYTISATDVSTAVAVNTSVNVTVP